MTNKDLQAYGRQVEEERARDRAVFLLHRIRVLEDDMKLKLETIREYRQEYDAIKRAEAERRQTKLFEEKTHTIT